MSDVELTDAERGSAVETLLVEVLAAHGFKVSLARGVERCWCGESTVGDPGWYVAHVAAEQAKALREWLTSGGAVSCIEDHSWSHRAHRVCRCGFNADPNKREFSVTQHARHVLAALTDLIGADS